MARKTRAPARQSRARKKERRSRAAKKGRKTAAPHKRKAAAKVAPPPKPSSPAKPGRPFYLPEFMAEARRRIEQTTESMTSIAGKLGMHHSALSRLVKRERWRRPEAALRRRGLSPAMRLAVEADALADAPAPPDPAALDRVEQAVLKELATVEAMRESLDKEPLRPIDAERTARTLSILTETLTKLRRHRLAAAAPAGPDHDDDFPADPDGFREDLARRIAAFMESRPDEDDAGANAASSVGRAR